MNYEYQKVKTSLDSTHKYGLKDMTIGTSLNHGITIEMWNYMVQHIISFIGTFGSLGGACEIMNEYLKGFDNLGYSSLSNKPSINGKTLEGNLTTEDIGIKSLNSVDIAYILR